MTMPDAVTFDFWNTLMIDEPTTIRDARVAAWLAILGEANMAVDGTAIANALASAKRAYILAWEADEQYGAIHSTDHCLKELGLAPPAPVRARLVHAVAQGAAPGSLKLAPNVVEALDALREGGVRIGIICDVGWTPSPVLREMLQGHGVLERFSHWSFSDDVGCYKPSPGAFAHALAGLGVEDPARAAHVGDLRRTDVAGARSFGMRSVRYAGVFDDDSDLPDADAVITDHAGLVTVLRGSTLEHR
jgi:FMN phosphatase YigB (HAD superfamily)